MQQQTTHTRQDSKITTLLCDIALAHIRANEAAVADLLKRFRSTDDQKQVTVSLHNHKLRGQLVPDLSNVSDERIKTSTPVNTWIEKWGRSFESTCEGIKSR